LVFLRAWVPRSPLYPTYRNTQAPIERGDQSEDGGIMGVFQILWVYYGLLIASRSVIAWNLVAVNFLSVAAPGPGVTVSACQGHDVAFRAAISPDRGWGCLLIDFTAGFDEALQSMNPIGR
jgi:hypothetical protein